MDMSTEVRVAIARRRERLQRDPSTARQVYEFAHRESFAADHSRSTQDAWAGLASEAKAVLNRPRRAA